MADDDKQGDGFDPWAELESTPGPDAEGGFEFAFDEAAEPQDGELPPAPPSAELDAAVGGTADADAGFGGSDEEISDWLADVADGEIEPTPLGVFSGDDDVTSADVGDPDAVRVGFGESGIIDDDPPISATDSDGAESPAAADSFGWDDGEIESAVESAPFGVVGAEPDEPGGEATEFEDTDFMAATTDAEPENGGFAGAAGDLAMAAAGGAAAIVTGTKPTRSQRARKGGLGQIIGIALGGLLALPITFAILIWGFRKDPLQIVRNVPESMAFLFPQELVSGGRSSPVGLGAAPTLDDVPEVVDAGGPGDDGGGEIGPAFQRARLRRDLEQPDAAVGAGDGIMRALPFDIGAGGFQQFRRRVAALLDGDLRRFREGGGGDDGRRRPARAAAARDGGGIALEDADAVRRHAEGGGQHLGIDRRMALALALRAGARRDGAIRHHLDDRSLVAPAA
jgi:hypothetical protein